MAFQRPFLISLKRADSHHKWGFSIKGGKDYGEPLNIQMVGEESLAERCGLREGDEVIQVGRVNIQDLTLGQVHELLARCGNKIEMFVVREDLLSSKKGKEPPVVKAVVHNPYNSPLSLYSTENIAETLAKQTEVLTEGQVSTEEDEGPENLSFKQKSAVFQLLEEQSKQESSPYTRSAPQSAPVIKPKSAPPPPPKPRPPPGKEQQLLNGYDTSHQQQVYQDQHQQRSSSRVEYQTSTRSTSQYQYEQPVHQQQTAVYQAHSYQSSPGHQSPLRENVQYQSSGYFSPTTNYQQSYQQSQAYQQPNQGYQSPTLHQPNQGYQSPTYQQPNQGYQSPTYQQPNQGYQSPTYQALNQVNYQQSQQSKVQASLPQSQQYNNQQHTQQQLQSQQRSQPQERQVKTQQISNQQQQRQVQSQQISNQQQRQQTQSNQRDHRQQETQKTAVSQAEFKIRPPPPPRAKPVRTEATGSMAAVYKQQYEEHLRKQYEQEQLLLNNVDEGSKPKAHIIEEDIFDHNCSSGTPITYNAPPTAPPKPHWPPPPSQQERFRSPQPDSPPGSANVASIWPPRKSNAVDLPRTGFNPAAVREQGYGRECVWPPSKEEFRSGRSTPQSPVAGRRIQWNPSPSPPLSRRTVFSTTHSPARRKDVPWPPPASQYNKENCLEYSPRMSRKAQFDDYIHQHASINVPQTYRPPPGTQHIEYR